ncbi:MAG: hypothetical protein ACREFK_17970 [Stellaceae bacterium]
MAAEALVGHVEVMAEAREPIPEPSPPDAPLQRGELFLIRAALVHLRSSR